MDLRDGSSTFNRLFTPEYDFDGALAAHDGHLSRGPCVVDVSLQVLGSHDVIGPSVRLPSDDGDLGDCGLGEGVQQFSPVANDAAVLLGGARQEA